MTDTMYTPPHWKFCLILTLILCLSTLTNCGQLDGLSPSKKADVYASKAPSNKDNKKIKGAKDLSISQGILFSASTDCTKADEYFAIRDYRVDRSMASQMIAEAPAPNASHLIKSKSMPLSPGDMVQVNITDGEGFNGRYIVGHDGKLSIPNIKPIDATGLDIYELSEKIELALVRAQLFRPATADIHVQLLQLSEIEVYVTGAVFESGRVLINNKIPAQQMEERTAAYGDFTSTRLLSEAVRAASGVRPDAKLDQVRLIRNGWQFEVDLSGIFTGSPVNDVALVAGDRVIIPSTGCFNPNLVRPTQISPKGFRVFMSNLIDSTYGNAMANIGSFSSSLPYGSRLLQAAISANCIGGRQVTNAPRKVMLASRNPLTGSTQVVERSVEELMRHPEREDLNPYIMPNDAIACYDSALTNVRDLGHTLMDLLNPIKLYRDL